MLNLKKLYSKALSLEDINTKDQLMRMSKDGNQLGASALSCLQFEVGSGGRNKGQRYAKNRATKTLLGNVANILMDAEAMGIIGPDSDDESKKKVELIRRYRELRYSLRVVYGGGTSPEHSDLVNLDKTIGDAYVQAIKQDQWDSLEKSLDAAEKQVENHEREYVESHPYLNRDFIMSKEEEWTERCKKIALNLIPKVKFIPEFDGKDNNVLHETKRLVDMLESGFEEGFVREAYTKTTNPEVEDIIEEISKEYQYNILDLKLKKNTENRENRKEGM